MSFSERDADPEALTSRVAPRVLVLDPSRPCLEAAADMLGFFGYSVYAVEDVDAALLALDTLAPHLVLVDVSAQTDETVERIRALRAGSSTPELPIVAMSVDVVPANHQALDSAGTEGWLLKPFTIEDLQALAPVPDLVPIAW